MPVHLRIMWKVCSQISFLLGLGLLVYCSFIPQGFTLNFSVGASWFHFCIESHMIRLWRLTFVVRFFQILWTFTHTNSCLFSFHSSWPSQCTLVVLLWHIAGTRNPCSLPFFLCTPYNTNLSQVKVREILMLFCDCHLVAELANRVVPGYYYMHGKYHSLSDPPYENYSKEKYCMCRLTPLPKIMKYESLRIRESQ